MTRTPRPRRDQVPAGDCLCAYCTAKCCKYFALPITRPTTWREFDDIRWYLAHDRTLVFVDQGEWYLMIQTRCKYLGVDERCTIYRDRPRVCRSYSTRTCEYDDDYVYDQVFEAPEQIREYAEALLGPRRVDRRMARTGMPPAPALVQIQLELPARSTSPEKPAVAVPSRPRSW